MLPDIIRIYIKTQGDETFFWIIFWSPSWIQNIHHLMHTVWISLCHIDTVSAAISTFWRSVKMIVCLSPHNWCYLHFQDDRHIIYVFLLISIFKPHDMYILRMFMLLIEVCWVLKIFKKDKWLEVSLNTFKSIYLECAMNCVPISKWPQW